MVWHFQKLTKPYLPHLPPLLESTTLSFRLSLVNVLLPTSVCTRIISLLRLNNRKTLFLSFLVLVLSGTTKSASPSASLLVFGQCDL